MTFFEFKLAKYNTYLVFQSRGVHLLIVARKTGIYFNRKIGEL
jgi:hypothetical protein